MGMRKHYKDLYISKTKCYRKITKNEKTYMISLGDKMNMLFRCKGDDVTFLTSSEKRFFNQNKPKGIKEIPFDNFIKELVDLFTEHTTLPTKINVDIFGYTQIFIEGIIDEFKRRNIEISAVEPFLSGLQTSTIPTHPIDIISNG